MIYPDHNATTPILPGVQEAVLPYLSAEWGHPPSTYRFGSRLKAVLENARDQVAELLGATSPRGILFTGSGTESNTAALHAALMSGPEKWHIVTSQA